MHDTAFAIGGLVFDTYCPAADAEILEIGSLDVNGSLRSHKISSKRYIGLDFESGEGVDHVIGEGYDWPVEDSSFDLVLASSAFEHDGTFWLTFLSMVRKTKPGGFIYINAPANGWVHRYPFDCWRFYPDSGAALAKWAATQGLPVSLVESFTAERRDDVWNDWCGVFRREPATAALPDQLVSDRIASVNVVSWKSEELVRPRDETEDMLVIEQERRARFGAEEKVVQLSAQIAAFTIREADLQASKVSLEAAYARGEAALQETGETIASLRTELEAAMARADASARLQAEGRVELQAIADQAAEEARQRAEAMVEITASAVRIAQLEVIVERSGKSIKAQESRLMTLEAERATMLADFRRTLSDKRANEDRLRFATAELSTMASMLKMGEAERCREAERSAWLRILIDVTEKCPIWWNLLPRTAKIAKTNNLLRRLRIFDADGYLARYPDVAAAGFQPLQHYILHGMAEGRLPIEQEVHA